MIRRLVILLVMALALSFTTNAVADGDPQGGPGDGSTCDYCTQPACGCLTVPGYKLYFECTCSALECDQSCTYVTSY